MELVHAEFQEELDWLNYTLDYLKIYNNTILNQKNEVDYAVDYSISHYNSDNAEQFNELILNSSIQEDLKRKIKSTKMSLDKPYFARIDFTPNDTKTKDRYYIGKMSLYKEDTDEFLIIDWRAPVATLYYEERLGSASYECVEGIIDGEITLKRQYFIEKGILNDIMDIDITTNDEFLQAALGSSKDNRLKDIVTTIQAEQNKVIRANMWNPLIVQGAAGGGKTTIALHRIAYLMYNNEQTLKPQNFMIIAPNRFFLSYISEVLPELGVENVTQTTYEDFVFNIIGKKLKLISPHEKLSMILDHYSKNNIKSADNLQKISCFKSSLIFANMCIRYIRNLEMNFLPKEDFKIHDFTLFSYKELQKRFLKDFNHEPLYKRALELKKSLVNKIEHEKPRILQSIEDDYEVKLNKIRFAMSDCPERRKEIISIIEERDDIMLKIKNRSKTVVKEYFSNIPKQSCINYYLDFLSNLSNYNKENVSLNLLQHIKNTTSEIINKKSLETEDLAPLLYIETSIYGLKDKIDVRHIVIDEAQDFSLFQFFSLKNIVNTGAFTILGDLCQGIYSYRGIKSWDHVAKYIFKNDSPTSLCLEQSYRTTVEIMDMANKVIESLKLVDKDINLPKAKPVIRHGNKVEVCKKESLKEIASAIDEKINNMDINNYKSLAIICKTLDECKALKKLIKNKISIITGSENNYCGGVVLIPSYLAKGLEFDMVIIANISEEIYNLRELDIKLLYVAMTRPLHELSMYYLNEITPILSDIK